MTSKSMKTALLASLFIVPILLSLGVHATPQSMKLVSSDAPYSIDVEPKKTNAKAGDTITYQLKVTAQTEFNDPIKFDLRITAMGYGTDLDLGTQQPPYPKEFEYNVKLPDNIPTGITATGILKATSGIYVVEEEVEITLASSSSGSGGFFEWLMQVLQDLWNRIVSIFHF